MSFIVCFPALISVFSCLLERESADPSHLTPLCVIGSSKCPDQAWPSERLSVDKDSSTLKRTSQPQRRWGSSSPTFFYDLPKSYSKSFPHHAFATSLSQATSQHSVASIIGRWDSYSSRYSHRWSFANVSAARQWDERRYWTPDKELLPRDL